MVMALEHSVYTKLVWEFYTTFRYRSKEARDFPTDVTFRLGGSPRQMSINGLAFSLGIQYHPYSRHEVKIPHPKDWNQDEFYRRIARRAYGMDYFDAG
ncbi:unnamed protein product [Linum trigynum]|uniref:Uncharacterized protein n=1 Tax=Linum trigynum TaxID=586398 RepID=A0AAV2E6R0_9ROSI